MDSAGTEGTLNTQLRANHSQSSLNAEHAPMDGLPTVYIRAANGLSDVP